MQASIKQWIGAISVSLIATLLYTVFQTVVLNQQKSPSTIVLICLGTLALLAVSHAIYLALGHFVLPYWMLWSEAKVRGLWKDRRLDRQIITAYCNCENGIIKIKATRAYKLIVSQSNKNFLECFKNPNIARKHCTIRLLLHKPCFHSSHLRWRAKVYSQQMEEFLISWWDVPYIPHIPG